MIKLVFHVPLLYNPVIKLFEVISMKESDNIQIPVKVDIRQLIETYSSHYVVNSIKVDNDFDNMFYIQERIGKKDTLNEWSHEHATLESARHAACNSIEIVKREFLKEYEEITSSFSWKLKKLLAKTGLLSSRDKEEFDIVNSDIVRMKQDIEDLKDKKTAIDVVLLQGEYNVPKYMPKLGETYYMLNINNLANVKLTPMQLIPEEVAIYDYRGSSSNDKFADQFDFKFSHYFEGPNGESTMIDSDRLVRFNGQYWKLGIMNYYLFVDEKEALVFAKKCAEIKVAGMQAELIAIAESMAKL